MSLFLLVEGDVARPAAAFAARRDLGGAGAGRDVRCRHQGRTGRRRLAGAVERPLNQPVEPVLEVGEVNLFTTVR